MAAFHNKKDQRKESSNKGVVGKLNSHVQNIFLLFNNINVIVENNCNHFIYLFLITKFIFP